MKATDILMEEHRVIERVIASMERQAHRLERGSKVSPAFFLAAAEFVQGFADGCHHRKEEGALFPAMVSAGVPNEGGPVGQMLAEHEQGRQLIRAMRGAAEDLERGQVAATRGVVANALAYATLLRQHIMKEDAVLFPMADRSISLSEQLRLAAEFERIEIEETGQGLHEKYEQLAEKLEAELG